MVSFLPGKPHLPNRGVVLKQVELERTPSVGQRPLWDSPSIPIRARHSLPAMAILTAFRCRAGSKPAPSPELLSRPQQQSSSSRELHQSWRGQHWPLMWVGACTGAVAGNQTEPWAVPICCFFLAPGSNSAYACFSQVESRFVTALL